MESMHFDSLIKFLLILYNQELRQYPDLSSRLMDLVQKTPDFALIQWPSPKHFYILELILNWTKGPISAKFMGMFWMR